jgi:hypothetical protein
MQIVIDIDEEDFEIMKHNISVDNPLCPLSQKEMVSKIANGTPLPKRHGDLKDVDKLKRAFVHWSKVVQGDLLLMLIEQALYNSPTIIEADRSKEE